MGARGGVPRPGSRCLDGEAADNSDQDQRKLESPLASFPPAPRQLPGVGTGGSGGRVKKNLEEDGGESRAGVPSEYDGTPIPPFLWVPSFR